MKRLGILLLPPGWDASRSQGHPPPRHYDRRYPFIHLGEERQHGDFLSKETKRRQRPGSNHRPSDQKSNVLTTRPPRLHYFWGGHMWNLKSARHAFRKLYFHWPLKTHLLLLGCCLGHSPLVLLANKTTRSGELRGAPDVSQHISIVLRKPKTTWASWFPSGLLRHLSCAFLYLLSTYSLVVNS